MEKLTNKEAQELLKDASLSREQVSIIYAQCGDHESALSLLWVAISAIENRLTEMEESAECTEESISALSNYVNTLFNI